MSKLLDKISGRLGIVFKEDEQNEAEIKELLDLIEPLKDQIRQMFSQGLDKDHPDVKAKLDQGKAIMARIDALKNAEANNAEETEPAPSEDASWKDPNSPSYDRREAENALFHTIGPLHEKPRWTNEWTTLGGGQSKPPSYFVPGGEAPTWTPEEIVFAYAGDPDMLGKYMRDNPRSPEYKGGAPLYRLARKIARKYRRMDDQFISDMYSNGLIPLVRMMNPGYDQARSPFISFINRTIEGAIENGSGSTEQAIKARADLKRVMDTTDPAAIESYLALIDGKYKSESSWDKVDGNPYGPYSPEFYESVGYYLSAINSGEEAEVDAARSRMRDLLDKIDDDNVFILGATTGAGQAISTPNRDVSSVGITSMDLPAGEEGKGTFGDTLVGQTADDSAINDEMVNYVLNLAMNYDLGKLLYSSEKYSQMAIDLGAKKGKIGGPMSANEFRYLIRALGPIASNYPGKGVVRDTTKPRDAAKWWQPGTDPEIEPIPSSAEGAMWNSIWSRNGYLAMTTSGRDGYGVEVNAIAEEMTQEVVEFNQLGIPTARTLKTKVDKRTGEEVPAPVVSAVSVSTALRSARVKFAILADIEKGKFDLDESIRKEAIVEQLVKLDDVDFDVMRETAAYIASKLVIAESKPVSTGIDFTPVLKENKISRSEVSNLLNELGMSSADVLKVIEQQGANFRDPSNIANVIKKAAAEIAKNYRGYAADLDANQLTNMVNYIWQNRPNVQHSVGSQSDDMPMVGKDIQSRF
jgi:hypothetical protein